MDTTVDATKTLDPADWGSFRRQAHQMLDDMLDHTENLRESPLWQPIPRAERERWRSPVPHEPASLAAVHEIFLKNILPRGSGNAHPGFLGWVQGGGTPVGMLAEMLAAGMNSNLGGRDHIPLEVERQVVEWVREIFGFPRGSTGLFVTGTSMANLLAVVVARDAAASPNKLIAYASEAVHGCVAKAMDVSGLGSDALRLIRTDSLHRIDIAELQHAIDTDRLTGFTPFLILGTAGTVDIGAIDDLTALADLARIEKLWFHVDGAYAALGILAPDLAPRFEGIERADSLAFDFHKWGQVPYAAGFLLVRHGVLHRDTFANPAAYLRRGGKGLAGGSDWPCDLGVDLSRGFQALKVWFTLKVYGTDALGAMISERCSLARYLEKRIDETPELELMAPVQLNIVCFRFRAPHADRLNGQIVVALQEAGEVAPSTTILDGQLAIRAAIVNHRTTRKDIDLLLEQTLSLGRALQANAQQSATFADSGSEMWGPRRQREEALRTLDMQLDAEPDSLELRLQRAGLLGELGRTLEAREDYLAVLARDPTHCTALNHLGTLLYGTGHRTAARTAYSEAVARHPTDVTSLVNLANVLVEDGDQASALEHYETALRFEPGRAATHQGIARALVELGDERRAAAHRRLGYSHNPLTVLPYRGSKPPVSVLLLASAQGGNIPLRHLLDDRVFQTSVLMADYYDQREALPCHQVVFNAIGDADLAADALVAAESILALTAASVINAVGAVSATGRMNNARRLRLLPSVVAPKTVTFPREALESGGETALALHGFEFPLLLRTPGFHTGRHFSKIDRAEDLASGLAALPGRDLTVIEFLDARGRDGKARKYRVMMIDGQLYPLHLAVSDQWKIHYFTADMANSPEHRAEDAAFLEDMPGVLGPLAMTALARIQTALGLDYAGSDFGLNEAGEVLLFEANATMVVLPPEPKPQWAYRRAAVERIFSGVRTMIADRASVAISPS